MPENKGGVSVFAKYPPADEQYLKQWTATMAAAFPQNKPEFWTICVKIIRRDGLSKERLQYIAEYLCRNWRYSTMQIADIIGVDKVVKIWSYRDFYREFRTTAREGYCIIKERAADGTIQFCTTADAVKAGLEIQQKF